MTREDYYKEVLRRIAKDYMTVRELKKHASKYGLTPAEHIEMAYENIRGEAKHALKKSTVRCLPVLSD